MAPRNGERSLSDLLGSPTLARLAEKETKVSPGRHMAKLAEQAGHLTAMICGVVYHVLHQLCKGVPLTPNLEVGFE